MEEKNNIKSLFPCAMSYGMMLGVGLIVKFAFLPLGFRYTLCQLLFLVGTLLVPVALCYIAKLYRDNYLGGKISFMHTYTFGYLTFLFASLVVALAHFVYFEFIDRGYMYEGYMQQLASLRETAGSDASQIALLDSLTKNLQSISELSSISLTIQLLFQNIFFGAIFSLIPAFLIRKK